MVPTIPIEHEVGLLGKKPNKIQEKMYIAFFSQLGKTNIQKTKLKS